MTCIAAKIIHDPNELRTLGPRTGGRDDIVTNDHSWFYRFQLHNG